MPPIAASYYGGRPITDPHWSTSFWIEPIKWDLNLPRLCVHRETTYGVSTNLLGIEFLLQVGLPQAILAIMTGPPQGPLGWSLGSFAQMFPTRICSYTLLGPLTSILPKMNTENLIKHPLRHTRTFQGKIFERHGHYWTFDLQTSRKFKHCLLTSF